jgi:hypothetical protein
MPCPIAQLNMRRIAARTRLANTGARVLTFEIKRATSRLVMDMAFLSVIPYVDELARDETLDLAPPAQISDMSLNEYARELAERRIISLGLQRRVLAARDRTQDLTGTHTSIVKRNDWVAT